jgi:hypothetical protein
VRLILAGEGGVPGQGVVMEGVKGVKYSPKPPRMCNNGEKRRFPALIDLKIAKNTVFYLKVLNKI